MNDGVGRVYQPIVAVLIQTKPRIGQVSKKNPDLRQQILVESLKGHMQLQRIPQSHFSVMGIAPPNQYVQGRLMLLQQIGSNMCANVSRSSSKKNCHLEVITLFVVLLTQPDSSV